MRVIHGEAEAAADFEITLDRPPIHQGQRLEHDVDAGSLLNIIFEPF
jgi:hypothetical protein